MKKSSTKFAAGLSSLLTMSLLVVAPVASAASATVTVTPSNSQGWSFNPDPTTATPYEFSEDEASIGEGSLFVPSIGANASDKFIAAKSLGGEVADLQSVGYDFLIAGNGDAADANQFYLNVYTNLAGSSTFYDCRFDYTPTTGSTADFTTALFATTDTPVNVGDRTAGGDTFDCPNTLAEMPAGSTVSVITLNVGDTSTSDVGLAGYLDRAVVTTTSGDTTYDFEQDPVTLNNKDECKKGGWMASEAPEFKNQGDCVSHFASGGKAKGNPVISLLRRFF